MSRFPGLSKAGFMARWRSTDHHTGKGETESAKQLPRAHRSTRARRRLGAAAGLLGSLGLVAGILEAGTTLPAAAAGGTRVGGSYVVNSLSSGAGSPAGPGLGDGCEVPGAGTVCTLPVAVADADLDTSGTDSITFASSLAGGTITLGATLSLTNSVVPITIGNSSGGAGNIIINGNSAAHQPFNIATGSAAVTLQNLTITAGGAVSPGGGDVYTNSLLTLNTVTVQNGNDGGFAGAGIYVGTSGNVTATNLTVTGNQAAGADQGGGIWNGGIFNSMAGTTPLTVTNNDTTTGKGSFGGGIYNATGATFNAAGLVVSGNGNTTFGKNGGGIDNNGTFNITGASATITNNTVAGDGAGLDNESGGTFTDNATATTITGNNAAAGSGGGVSNESGALSLTLASSTIQDNSAGVQGGGIFNNGAGLTVTNGLIGGTSQAFANTAPQGGGFDNTYTGTNTPYFNGDSINYNKATTGVGGGINDTSQYGFDFNLGSLSDNTAATAGGGANIAATAATLEDDFFGTAINANLAMGGNGGGIDLTAGGLDIGPSGTTTPSLIGNTAGTSGTGADGGALFLATAAGVTCNQNSNPIQPTPPVPNLSNALVCVDSATISGNTAYNPTGGGVGGGIDVDNATTTLLVSRSTVSSNTAYTQGGGIALTLGSAEIVDTTIGGPSVGNTVSSGNATQEGAGIYTAGAGGIDVYYSTIDYNDIAPTANGDGAGAGVYLSSTGASQMTDDTINQNYGSTNGGGIDAAGTGTLGLNNDTIANNTASNPTTTPSAGAGGGLYVNGATVNTTGTVYTGDIVGNAAVGTAQNECSVKAGTLHSVGFNLDQGASCGFSSALGDKSGGNANLGTFAANGGIAGTANYALVSPSDALGTQGNYCPTYGQNASSNSATTPTPCNMGSWQGSSAPPPPPSGAPGQPTGLAATAGNGQATFTWAAPTTGGSPTSYTVSCSPSGSSVVTGSPPVTNTVVTGLSNGTTYTCTVTASNGSGSGPASTSVNVVPTSTVVAPGQVTGLSATAGNGQATFIWSPPSTGGAPTAYTVTCTPSGSAVVATTSATITGLSNGVTYTCSVTASNSGGSGAPSSSVSVTPTSTVAAPGQPTNLVGSPGNGQATFTWNPPTTGGSPTSYTVTCSPGGSVVVSGTSATIGGLTNGVTYTCTVTASNSAGNGPASAATVVTPQAPPPPPPPHGPCVQAGYSGNSAFVCQAYLDLLGRFPDAGGLATWLGQLAAGVSRQQVANAIDTSTEYRTDYINADYEGWLGRPVDPGGLATWLGQFAAGATEEQIDAGILGSNEFFVDSGSNNTGFLDNLYQALLGRAPDPTGFATFSAQLASGVSRTQVALEIDTSHEQHVDDVTFYYSYFLGRAPDAGGLALWVGLLDSGTRDEAVVAGIVGSNEFFTYSNR